MIGWLVALILYCLGVVSAQADWDEDKNQDDYGDTGKIVGYCLMVILWPVFMVIFIFRRKETDRV